MITVNNIEFTDTPPTKPGAYWCLLDDDDATPEQRLRVVNVITPGNWRGTNYLWSKRLVLVGEVGNAYLEGWDNATDPNLHGFGWKNSHARSV